MSTGPLAERELFDRLVDVAAAERVAALDALCPDGEIRARVRALLDAHDRAGQHFLSRSASELTAAAIGRSGRRLGAYQIVREIGRGGMGAVYLATRADDEFQKQVAIKIVAAPLGDEDLIRRFRRERQILAQLDDPRIAGLLDGGTTEEGLPYLVMELVDGLRVDDYCTAHRLSVPERLRLFCSICDAVQYAHGHLVVHRDLKPQNILVTADGQPKLLDFGVASLLISGGDGGAPATRIAAMTPEYASPEQIRGDPVTAASDIYSLGVLLYELLTGLRPHDVTGKRPDEAYRILTADDPVRPSVAAARAGHDARARRLRGDVDAIVLHALRKEPARRYASVAQLADDVRRHLEGRPVTARGEAVSYRAWAFVRRHRYGVAAAATVGLSLVGGIAATTWMAMEAERAGTIAVRERDRAMAAESAATSERDRAVRAEQLAGDAQRGAEDERNRALEQSRRADREAAIANAVREFLANDVLAQAGATAQAAGKATPNPDLRVRDALDRAAERIAGRFDTQPVVEAAIRQVIGVTYKDLGLYAEAEQQLAPALALRTRALGPDHLDTLTSASDLGNVYLRRGKRAEAEAILTRAVNGFRAVSGEDDRATLGVLNSLVNATVVAPKRTALYERILRAQQRVLGEDHPDTLGVMNNLAASYLDSGRYADGEQLYTRLVAAKTRVLGKDHPSTLLSRNALGVTFRYLGRYAEAEAVLSEVLASRQRTLGPQHLETLLTTNSLANVYVAQARYEEAEALLRQTLATRRRELGERHSLTIGNLNNLAELYRRQGRLGEAEDLWQQVLDVRRGESGPDHPNTINVLTALGELKLEQREYADAERYLAEALSAFERTHLETWRRSYTQGLLGASLYRRARFDDAEPLLVASREGLIRQRRTMPAENHQLVIDVTEWLAAMYRDWGKPEKAAALVETPPRH